jgi:hypothetical protein
MFKLSVKRFFRARRNPDALWSLVNAGRLFLSHSTRRDDYAIKETVPRGTDRLCADIFRRLLWRRFALERGDVCASG